METKLIQLRLKAFLYDNDFKVKHLPESIGKQIEWYYQWHSILPFVSAKGHSKVLKIVFRQDQSIITKIKAFFYQQIASTPTTNDIELIEQCYNVGYTDHISITELRALGLEHPLPYKTTIFGKFKLSTSQNRENKNYRITPLAVGNAHKEAIKMRSVYQKPNNPLMN